MTKYVVQSGGIENQPELKRKFHREVVKGLGKKPKFVLCNFAQGREYWEVKFPGYCDTITEDMPDGVKPTFELAMPDQFIEQCEKADVIYFHGGDDHLLQYWMRQYDTTKLFKDKVVATNSASSDMLATHYWTCDWRQCGDGFGILPIKFIPHYKSDFGDDDPRGPIDWDRAYKELRSYKDKGLPIVALEEGEYKVYRV
ncbi:hypothetical protein A3B63_00760 [Candidatus Saccharibacteria bacterium RIFCSPLOWO2_01_FULL_49_22]|nr:MAG: hypothetical protein A3B63_00760 [Candidatus Saccharibacteria bacterium RIFCSPLOWO2_01_FULL_49_22]